MRSVEAGQPLGEVLTHRQKWLLIASLMVAMFIGALDLTVVTTATPRILADLGGFHLLSWLFTSYMLASTVVIPLVGKLSDIYGRRTFLLVGIAVFLVASVACGAAQNMEMLIAFRVVQGLGGGMVFASVFACIGDIFAPAERSKYMGLFTGVFSLASVLGPALGGFLTDNGGWRWVFYINVPFCLIALPAIWHNLPARHGGRRPRIDYAGAATLSVAVVLTLLALELTNDYAWGSPQILALFTVAAVALVAFVAQERRHPEPILPLYLFRNSTFLLSNAVVFIMGMGMFAAIQYLGIYVQTALDASASASGIIATPQSLGLLAASVIGGQLIARTGRYRYQTLVGGCIVVGALLLLRTLGVDTQQWTISVYVTILGFGFGLLMPTMTLSVQNAVPYEHLGVATSSSQFFRQIGSVFGIALFALILTNVYESTFHDALSTADREAIAATGTLPQFEDPTLALNDTTFAAVQAKVTAVSGGAALLERARDAQKAAVAKATQDIFTVSAISAGIALLLLVGMREIPLRRSFGQRTGEGAAVAEAGTPATGAPASEPPGAGRGAWH